MAGELEGLRGLEGLKELIEDIITEKNLKIRKFEIKTLDPKEVKPDIRALWKCRFGCNYYGMRKSCPPFTPPMSEIKEFLSSYSVGYAIVFRYEGDYMSTKREIQELLVALEGKLLLEHPMVFTLFPGGCDLCEDCKFPDYGECRARPTVSSMGIKVSEFGVSIGDKKLVGILLVD
jgi:predicted metal-binding protein